MDGMRVWSTASTRRTECLLCVLVGSVVVSCSGDGGVPKELRASAADGESAPDACDDRPGSPTDLALEPAVSPTSERYRWRDERGCPVRVDVIGHALGDDEHCDQGSVEIISVGTPVGSQFKPGNARRFVWDPSDVLGEDVDRAVTINLGDLPDGAVDSGFRLGDVELWHDPTDADSLYRISGDEVQVLGQDRIGLSLCA